VEAKSARQEKSGSEHSCLRMNGVEYSPDVYFDTVQETRTSKQN